MRGVRVVPLVLLAACAACDRDNDRADNATADSADVAEDGDATARLLAPVRAVSMVEVEFGGLGAQRAANNQVRQYAYTVATDHRALIVILDSVARVHRAVLTEAGPAQEIGHAVRIAHSGLENTTGEEFDLPFVRAEIESHRQLLERLDQDLLPSATSAGVRQLLTDIRAMADAHLTRSRQLLAQLLQPPEPPPGPRPQRPAAPPGAPPRPPDG